MRGCEHSSIGSCAVWPAFVSGAILLVVTSLGCGGAQGARSAGAGAGPRRVYPPAWSLTSRAFKNSARIPPKYTVDGQNVSPDLNWTAPPGDTVELALICDDPDAPRGTWTHWVLYSLPASRRSLAEAVPKTETLSALGGAKQGKNSFGATGYDGPSPPRGPVHHYHFVLYALNAKVRLSPGAQKSDLERAMKGHIIAQAELVGLYSR
jgi:Raf kinase inhibitor-like YbhB/YbcL family protein